LAVTKGLEPPVRPVKFHRAIVQPQVGAGDAGVLFTVNVAVAVCPVFKLPTNSALVVLVTLPIPEAVTFTRITQLLFAPSVPLLNEMEDAPAEAKYNVVAQNICVGGRWLDLANGLSDKTVTIENNLTDADPRFVDADKQDFRLEPDSPALKLGFEPIPVEQIGLYADELRASWPPTSQPE